MKFISKFFFLAVFSLLMTSSVTAQSLTESAKPVLKGTLAQDIKQHMPNGTVITLLMTDENNRPEKVKIQYAANGDVEVVPAPKSAKSLGTFKMSYDGRDKTATIKTKEGVELVSYKVAPKSGGKTELKKN